MGWVHLGGEGGEIRDEDDEVSSLSETKKMGEFRKMAISVWTL